MFLPGVRLSAEASCSPKQMDQMIQCFSDAVLQTKNVMKRLPTDLLLRLAQLVIWDILKETTHGFSIAVHLPLVCLFGNRLRRDGCTMVTHRHTDAVTTHMYSNTQIIFGIDRESLKDRPVDRDLQVGLGVGDMAKISQFFQSKITISILSPFCFS